MCRLLQSAPIGRWSQSPARLAWILRYDYHGGIGHRDEDGQFDIGQGIFLYQEPWSSRSATSTIAHIDGAWLDRRVSCGLFVASPSEFSSGEMRKEPLASEPRIDSQAVKDDVHKD
jgi:hypothetical protein